MKRPLSRRHGPDCHCWIRGPEVRELTGWNAQYVAKLRKAGVLRTHQVTERGWPWYERSQVMEILNGENK